jgi:hypothetical protein
VVEGIAASTDTLLQSAPPGVSSSTDARPSINYHHSAWHSALT